MLVADWEEECGPNWSYDPWSSRCYAFRSGVQVNWDEAMRKCREDEPSEGQAVDLVSITGPTEQQFINGEIKRHNITPSQQCFNVAVNSRCSHPGVEPRWCGQLLDRIERQGSDARLAVERRRCGSLLQLERWRAKQLGWSGVVC